MLIVGVNVTVRKFSLRISEEINTVFLDEDDPLFSSKGALLII